MKIADMLFGIIFGIIMVVVGIGGEIYYNITTNDMWLVRVFFILALLYVMSVGISLVSQAFMQGNTCVSKREGNKNE